ncbi:D-alanine--D-alanine ligase A-like [Paramacrobiotus metropolitanus]|uniref:D-alanine--D-alanine ligase A-like n=1 Tax=Paramacrobiotus metropolitanus TaxID=2943436 RepID=UPI002445DE91|nr:D-alanine--D-alanine ligase A-like [Paramacrobiotus metropolitanus]
MSRPSAILFDTTDICILIGGAGSTAAACAEGQLVNEYGKQEDAAVLKTLLDAAGFTSTSVHVLTLDNFRSVLDNLQRAADQQNHQLLLVNLIDGVETDGYPGVSVVREIEERRIPFTGSDSRFYHDTTSKPHQKAILQKHGVNTAAFVEILPEKMEDNMAEAVNLIGFPMIIKPSVSYASLGISADSVVSTVPQLRERLTARLVHFPQLFVERYLPGREYTVLVSGDAETGVKVYKPVERRFSEAVPVEERFLAYEKYWAGYGLHGTERAPDAPHEEFYEWTVPSEGVAERVVEVARRAYLALGGSGYARLDIRSDDYDPVKGNLSVLEANANPGLSFSVSSSIGKIIESTGESPAQFLMDMLDYAVSRGTRRDM